jgi:hypothetical protein
MREAKRTKKVCSADVEEAGRLMDMAKTIYNKETQ